MRRICGVLLLAGLAVLAMASCRGSRAVPTPSLSPSPDEAQLFVFTYGPDLEEISSRPNLMLCEPVRYQGPDVSFEESFAIAPIGAKVVYRPNSCMPDIDIEERIAVSANDGTRKYVRIQQSHGDLDQERIIWMPALLIEDENVQGFVGSARFLEADASVECDEIGCHVSASVESSIKPAYDAWTKHMFGVRVAYFLNGFPIRDKEGLLSAPWVASPEPNRGIAIVRLGPEQAANIADLINSGALY